MKLSLLSILTLVIAHAIPAMNRELQEGPYNHFTSSRAAFAATTKRKVTTVVAENDELSTNCWTCFDSVIDFITAPIAIDVSQITGEIQR